MMRTLCTQLALAFTVLTTSVSAAGLVDEPYTVFVVEDGYTRCGPSGDFYRTDRVAEGDKLEVYVETDDGWLGIRPPESSFCWLPSDQVEMDRDGVDGKIIDPEAVAWIGTNLGRARKYRWQIKLQIGEQVAVIGEMERETATGEKETWYRIVPPAGEFRWVHDSQVVIDRDQVSSAKRARQAEQMAMAADKRRRDRALSTDPPSISEAAPKPFDARAARAVATQSGGEIVGKEKVAQVGFQQEIPTHPIQSDLNVGDRVQLRSIRERTPGVPQNTAPWVQSNRNASKSRDSLQREPRTSRAVPMPKVDEGSLQLQQMQIEFARLMAADAAATQFDALRMRTELAATSAASAVDRGQARMLSDRIAKYQDLARQRIGGTRPSPATSNVYDRQGWLQRVYSARPDAPQYALTDRDGKTIAYISPATGMNFRRYLNKEVGIIGEPRYLTGIDTPHFVADRVVPLKR